MLFINTFFIFLIVFAFFLYKLAFDKAKPLIETFTPLRILNAQSVSPRSLITAHEVGVLNV